MGWQAEREWALWLPPLMPRVASGRFDLQEQELPTRGVSGVRSAGQDSWGSSSSSISTPLAALG